MIRVDAGHRDVERIRFDDDVSQCPQPQPAERFATGVGDRPHLSLRVGAGTLYPHLFDELLGRQSLDGPVQAAHGDIGPQRHVLLFGEKSQLVTVHRPALLQCGEEKDPNGRHATTLARVVA